MLIFPHGNAGFCGNARLVWGGGARKPSSNFHAGRQGCPCLLCIQNMVTPPPTVIGQLILSKNQLGSNVNIPQNVPKSSIELLG